MGLEPPRLPPPPPPPIYRVGRTLGRTLYRRDVLIGMMDSEADAALVVACLNVMHELALAAMLAT